MSPEQSKRIDHFLAYYAQVHEFKGAFDVESADQAHREAAQNLYDQSIDFLDRLRIDGIEDLLDVGLGYGNHCAYFADKGLEVTGVSVDVPESLRTHAASHGYKIQCMDMHFLDYEDESFDMVWSHHSLEHAFSQLYALREWYRVLRPGGLLAVTVPPHKTKVVSGHFCTGWSVGQLAYLLGVTGFELSDGYFVREGYNVRGVVRRPLVEINPKGLSWIDQIADNLPPGLRELLEEHPNSQGRFQYEGEIKQAGSMPSACIQRSGITT